MVVAVDHFRVLILQSAGLDNLPKHFELGMNGGFAVMFFYMISGFLISTALSEKYPATIAGSIQFYQGRFIRIFALYWPMLLLIFGVFGFWSWFANLSLGDKFTNVFIIGMDWRILFAGYPEEWHWDAATPFFHQTWTLGAELTFYLLAPFILRSWKIALALLLASAVVRGYLVATTVFDGRWTYVFAPSTFLFFLLGHFSQVLSRRWSALKSALLGTLALTLSLLCIQFEAGKWDSAQFWGAAVLFAAALPGIFAGTKQSAFLNYVGDLSFPVYLVHTIVIAKVADWNSLALFPRSPLLITLAFLALVIVAAVLSRYLLEQPTARAMRWLAGLIDRRLQPTGIQKVQPLPV